MLIDVAHDPDLIVIVWSFLLFGGDLYERSGNPAAAEPQGDRYACEVPEIDKVLAFGDLAFADDEKSRIGLPCRLSPRQIIAVALRHSGPPGFVRNR